MADLTLADRATALLESPAGTVLLMMVVDNEIPIADLAQPEIGLHAIAQAVGEISPWNGFGHERIKRTLHVWRDENRSMLEELALAIVSQSEVAWWWEGVDRQHQLWLPQDEALVKKYGRWLTKERFLAGHSGAVGDWSDPYGHEPQPLLSTSNYHGRLSPELAHVGSRSGDLYLLSPVELRKVTIHPDARILELHSARDWHNFVLKYPADGERNYRAKTDPRSLAYELGWPWGNAPGLLVPDWRAAAEDWDGVHISPWTYLTAIQVRVESEAGWTQPWSWEGPHTVWLDWVFETVEDLPAHDLDDPLHHHGWMLPRLNFSDPAGWLMMPQSHFETLATMHAPGYERTMTNRVTREPFGELDGHTVERITLNNAIGMSVSILTYGGIIQQLSVPDRDGTFANVALGFDNLDDYVAKSPYFGEVVGRFANRIANGRFTLDGVTYEVPVNNGPNSLHGGIHGFDKQVWNAVVTESEHVVSLVLTYTSPDGEEGYPGTLTTSVRYDLMANSPFLRVTYQATTDAPTVLNLSNHCYFNLAGEGTGSILDHVIQLRANRYLPVNPNLIPIGELASVAGTPFDFTEAHVIGERIDRPGDEQLAIAGGYDHCFVFDTADDLGFIPNWQVKVVDPASGRVMTVQTDQPGVQFYSGNFLDGSFAGTSGKVYERRAGFCLETQHFPDSPNQPDFPSTVLRPGEEFVSSTTFGFGVQ